MRILNTGACTADLVSFPIAVKIDPHAIDAHRPLIVRLAYKIHYGGGEGTKQWHKTLVAPALARA